MNNLVRCFLALGLLAALAQAACESKKKSTTSASTGISATVNSSKF